MERVTKTRNWRREPTRDPPYPAAEMVWEAGPPLLYYHAIELYLKGYLCGHGHSVKELRTKFGHRVISLSEETKRCGLRLEDEDEHVFSLMADTDDVMAYCYIRRGHFTRPAHEALDRACTSIHHSVGEALQKHGINVRL